VITKIRKTKLNPDLGGVGDNEIQRSNDMFKKGVFFPGKCTRWQAGETFGRKADSDITTTATSCSVHGGGKLVAEAVKEKTEAFREMAEIGGLTPVMIFVSL
jgi:hypothetical protein